MRRTLAVMSTCTAMLLVLGATVAGFGTEKAHAQSSSAYMRVVHAAPAAPTVDVYVDGTKLLTSFTFGTVTGYVPVSAGGHQIAVVPAGQPASAAVINQQVNLSAGTSYTAAAIGDANTTPALVAFADNNTLVSGKARVRVYHLSSDAGPVSVATGGQTVIPDLTFKNASDYLSVSPGSYTFDVTLKDNGKAVSTSAALSANQITSIFALGLVGGSGDIAFRFVAATISGTPSGLPPTGFDPHPAGTNSTMGIETPYFLAALAVMLSTGLIYTRRRLRRAQR